MTSSDKQKFIVTGALSDTKFTGLLKQLSDSGYTVVFATKAQILTKEAEHSVVVPAEKKEKPVHVAKPRKTESRRNRVKPFRHKSGKTVEQFIMSKLDGTKDGQLLMDEMRSYVASLGFQASSADATVSKLSSVGKVDWEDGIVTLIGKKK